MATFRFLHCADLHLDSPLRGLEADPDAPAGAIRGATRKALENLVDHALAERLDFVVVAGDLYDGDWQDWRTGRFLIAQIRRLSDAGIPFIAIRGNHDAESVITRRLRMPADTARWLNAARPETVRLPNLPVSIHGQSFANRAIPEDLARDYPPPDPGRFNIGLLHTSAGGSTLHSTYAPCDIAQLRAHGYDYWALGHIHQRAVLSDDPWIVFPGNLQGRHANETGPKGATVVTVVDGRVASVVEVPFDAVRWARISVELNEADDEDSALSQVRAALADAIQQAGGRLLAARVTVFGACAAHEAFSHDLGGAREKIRAEALAAADPGTVWIEAIELATRPPPDLAALRERTDAIGMVARTLETIRAEELLEDTRNYAAALLDRASPLRQAIGADNLAARVVAGDIPDDLLRRARDLLLAELAGE